MGHTGDFILKACELRVGIIDDVVDRSIQISVSIGQDLATMAFPDSDRGSSSVCVCLQVFPEVPMARRDEQVLCHLVGPKAQRASCTFHDSLWAQSTEDTGFVVLAGVEVGDHGIIRPRQMRLACWAYAAFCSTAAEASMVGAIDAKGMAILVYSSQVDAYNFGISEHEDTVPASGDQCSLA